VKDSQEKLAGTDAGAFDAAVPFDGTDPTVGRGFRAGSVNWVGGQIGLGRRALPGLADSPRPSTMGSWPWCGPSVGR